MQDLILESDFDVNYSLLSSLLEKMSSMSDLYLLPLNQLVPSPTHFSRTGVSSIIHLCSSQASATHWNTYQPYLFSSRHYPSSINLYPILSSLSSLQHQNSLLFIPPATELWNSLPLHIRIFSSLSTLFNLFYFNSIISSLATVHFKLSPRHHLSLIHVPYIWLFTHRYLSIISCILHLATYTSSSFVH